MAPPPQAVALSHLVREDNQLLTDAEATGLDLAGDDDAHVL